MSRPFRCARRGLAVLVMSTGAVTAAPAQTFDHSAFDALLKAHVVNGMVDYGAFRVADHADIDNIAEGRREEGQAINVAIRFLKK